MTRTLLLGLAAMAMTQPMAPTGHIGTIAHAPRREAPRLLRCLMMRAAQKGPMIPAPDKMVAAHMHGPMMVKPGCTAISPSRRPPP